MLKDLEHEIRLFLNKPLMVIVLLGAASAYALLIGNLYSAEIIQKIPVAVCDMDDSVLSRELIHAVMDADQYNYYETLHDEPSAIKLLDSEKVSAVLVIPNDFSKRFYLQQPIELAFIQDGSNIMQVSYALPPMQSVIGSFVAQYSSKVSIVNGTPQLSPSPVNLSLRTYGNPTQSYLEFYIYGVILMAAQFGICVAFSLSLHEDFYLQRRFSLAVKEIFYLSLSLASVLIAVFLLSFVFKLPFRGDPLSFIVLFIAFLFCMENVAGFFALLSKSPNFIIQCMIFYTLPAFLLSGYIWPEVGMIDIIKWISLLQPIHYILPDFRNLALVGVTSDYFLHISTFLTIGLILTSILYVMMKLRYTK